MNYRTKPFIRKLAEEGVVSRAGSPISISTLVSLEEKLELTVQRMARDKSRVWTDEHLQRIKDYWLEIVGEPSPASKSAVA